MTFGRWILGVALLAAVLSALALGARAIRRRFLPELDGPTALLADAIVTLSALVVLAELLGLVGLLEPAPLVVGAALAGAGGAALAGGVSPQGRGVDEGVSPRGRGVEEGVSPRGGGVYRGETPQGGVEGGRHSGGVGVLGCVAFAGAGLVAAAWVRRTLVSLDLGVGGVDSLWYHLPFAAEFARSGSTADVPYVDLEFLTAFYPANVELVHAVGMTLFGTAALSPLLSLAALALAFLAGWCIGRPFGVAPATLLATALVIGVPAMFESQAGEAKNDVAALAFLLAAAALLLTPDPRRATLAVAGAAAGLAAGTKLSFLAPTGALFVATLVLHRRGALAFVAAALPTGGPWYVRNLFATGNPLPWLGPLPQPEEARSEATATALSDYLFDADKWDTYFLPALDDVLGPLWPALVVAGIAGAIAAVLARTGAVRALGIVALLALAAYAVTPSSAAGPPDRPIGFGLNVRYALPALLLGACLLVIALRRWSAVTAGALASAVVVTQTVPDVIWAEEHRRKALALLVLGAGAVVLVRRRRVAAAVLAAASVAVLWPLERDFLGQQYTGTLQPYTSWQAFGLQPVYDWAADQRGATIAVTGTTGGFFQYPLTGPELDNDVELIGRHGDHGSFTPITDCRELRDALAGHTHAVVTPYLDIWDPYRPRAAPELACVRMTGAQEVLTSGRIHVFALR